VPTGDPGIIRVVRRLALLCCLAVVLAPGAHAAAPAVTVTASATIGQAPLSVTLSVSGDAASFSWDLGDGTSAVSIHISEPTRHAQISYAVFCL
jgi:PKD repeat protein